MFYFSLWRLYNNLEATSPLRYHVYYHVIELAAVSKKEIVQARANIGWSFDSLGARARAICTLTAVYKVEPSRIVLHRVCSE